jgi:hypothetical protein
MSQMDIKRRICDIQNCKKKHLFLDISSTNTDTLVTSFYQCVETRSVEVPFDCCLSHFGTRATWSSIICDFLTSMSEFLDPIVNRFTRPALPTVNRKHFFMNILCIESFCPQNRRRERCSSAVHLSSTVALLSTQIRL